MQRPGHPYPPDRADAPHGSSGASNVRYWLAVNEINGGIDGAMVEHVLHEAKLAGRPLTDEEIRRVIVAGR